MLVEDDLSTRLNDKQHTIICYVGGRCDQREAKMENEKLHFWSIIEETFDSVIVGQLSMHPAQ